MSKQSNTPEIRSFKDAAYRWAETRDRADSIAKYVIDTCPSFPEEVSKEVKAELYAGFQLRKHELAGEQYWKMGEGGHFIPLSDKPAKDAAGVVCMTINAAMSYSQQEFGKLKEKDPALHAIVSPMRKDFSNYASNAYKALERRVRELQNEGKPRERSANRGFVEALQKVFDTYEGRCKTAKDRGDNDADLAKYKAAVSAFWRCYNQQPQ